MKQITLHSNQRILPHDPLGKRNPTDKALNSKSSCKPQTVSALRQIAGLCQARVAHYHIHGPDTGSNSEGRWITKNVLLFDTFVTLCIEL